MRTREAGVVTVSVTGLFQRIMSADCTTRAVSVRRRLVAVTVAVGGKVAARVNVAVTLGVRPTYCSTIARRVIRRAVVVTSIVDDVLTVRALVVAEAVFVVSGVAVALRRRVHRGLVTVALAVG